MALSIRQKNEIYRLFRWSVNKFFDNNPFGVDSSYNDWNEILDEALTEVCLERFDKKKKKQESRQ